MIIFDGLAFAKERETHLQSQATALKARGINCHIAALLYSEDRASVLYTNLKSDAAKRVGIEYSQSIFSIADGIEPVLATIRQMNKDSHVTGIIIQKPRRSIWQTAAHVDPTDQKAVKQAFKAWWQVQTTQLAHHKDVDGLHPDNLAAFQKIDWLHQPKVLPATANGVLEILASYYLKTDFLHTKKFEWLPQLMTVLSKSNIAVVGLSDIVGLPLLYVFSAFGINVEGLGTQALLERQHRNQWLLDKDIIISATGTQHLITGEWVKSGVVIIDAGEPRPDVERLSVQAKAEFLTPVPGGVGPVTIVNLLQNALDLVGDSSAP